ncbi:hypothetical protein QYY77_01270 [Xanthomonas campestris pv. campestris]|uniref:hypothetical protein n=1 Tax=Xanthomonas campestris TaxID=339 RepID=UPI002AD397C0|nr:hypothetical protein [Xanthomonas campestris]MEA0734723.1 hypothetical protein [Xanthomonas campestris pv. campestris]
MQARRLIVIATLTLGLLMNHPSAAQSQIPSDVPHTGMSLQALERAYIESYEQSGFRLASRHEQSNSVGSLTIDLVFQLKSAPKGPDAPGTTLRILSYRPPGCGCALVRQSFRGFDADSPDWPTVARGEHALVKADTAALAKVRQRLGVSLPAMDMPIP